MSLAGMFVLYMFEQKHAGDTGAQRAPYLVEVLFANCPPTLCTLAS